MSKCRVTGIGSGVKREHNALFDTDPAKESCTAVGHCECCLRQSVRRQPWIRLRKDAM